MNGHSLRHLLLRYGRTRRGAVKRCVLDWRRSLESEGRFSRHRDTRCQLISNAGVRKTHFQQLRVVFQPLRNASSDPAAQAVRRAPLSPCPPGRACCAQLPFRARNRLAEAAPLRSGVPGRVLGPQGDSAAVSPADRQLSEQTFLQPAAAPEGNVT